MKLKYNILWLDDHIDDFINDDWLSKVEEHLSENGFEPNIIPVSNSDDFINYLNGDIDLILTDYNLVEDGSIGKNGDQIIELIRQSNNISTEILFYTARAKLEDIGQINRITFLETRKFSETHHKSVYNETIKLIDLTIRKFQHIIAMRGMIMHETSYLDETKKDIINSCFRCSELNDKSISDRIFCSINDFLNGKRNDFDRYKRNQNINQLMKDHVLFSADHQIEAIKEILLQLNTDDFSDDYSTEITGIRNKFAHSVLKQRADGTEYFEHGESGIIFDSAKCREIRTNIRKHKKNLEIVKNEIDKIS